MLVWVLSGCFGFLYDPNTLNWRLSIGVRSNLRVFDLSHLLFKKYYIAGLKWAGN